MPTYVVPHCTVDYAAAIDTLEETLCDEFDIPMEKAIQIAHWHREQLAQNDDQHGTDALDIIMGYLLDVGNIYLKAVGLVFASGLNRTNGWNTERTAARATGFTPAAINSEKNLWVYMLSLSRNEHSKSTEARQKYKENAMNNHWRKNFTEKTTNLSTQ